MAGIVLKDDCHVLLGIPVSVLRQPLLRGKHSRRISEWRQTKPVERCLTAHILSLRSSDTLRISECDHMAPFRYQTNTKICPAGHLALVLAGRLPAACSLPGNLQSLAACQVREFRRPDRNRSPIGEAMPEPTGSRCR